ncbi:MAG: PspC domain-containing protein [Patescibacteria group bacterium]
MKHFFRSKNNRRIAGLCGGLGEYLGVDANILRLLLILVALVTGVVPAIIGYIVAAIIIPEEGEED